MKMNNKGQANVIAAIGLIAAGLFVVFSQYQYIQNIGLSSRIYSTAEQSIYQTVAAKDYVVQQAVYNFDKAQLFDAATLAPVNVNCGYINTSQVLPYIPVPKVYYWDNAVGNPVCLPNNQQIVLGLLRLLNQSSFSTLQSTNSTVTEYLDINFSAGPKPGTFSAFFTAPYLQYNYSIEYNRTNSSFNITRSCKAGSTTCFSSPSYFLAWSPLSLSVTLEPGYSFVIGPEADTIYGALTQASSVSSFFSNLNLAPDSEYGLITMPDGNAGIVISNRSNGVYSFDIGEIPSTATSLSGVISEYKAIGLKFPMAFKVANNTDFSINGITYHFLVDSNIGGSFQIYPVNYAVISLQPQFVYYQYVINEFNLRSSENLVFPDYSKLYVSFNLLPYYNAQVCVSSNQVQFTLRNCLSLASHVDDEDYISNLLQLGISFVKQSFSVGHVNITGFPQYELYNYIQNVVHGVNMKTVSVAGQPKYDWYSSLILNLGSLQGTASLLQQISCAYEPNYHGTSAYNCSVTSSCLNTCRGVLQNTLESDLQNLFNYEIPTEVSFLAATPFEVNVLNLSVYAEEAPSCPDYAKYNTTFNYRYSFPKTYNSPGSEILGIPISLNFGYQNLLNLYPTENCGIQDTQVTKCVPGFTDTLSSPYSLQAYSCCRPVIATTFINDTCIANVLTNDSSTESFIQSADPLHVNCMTIGSHYYCENFHFYINSSAYNKYGFYQNWWENDNKCPNFFTVNGQNFTQSTKPSSNGYEYNIINDYGGGALSYPDSPNQWAYAYFSTNKMPVDFSMDVAFNMSGPAPIFNVLFSTNVNVQTGAMYAQLNGYNGNDGILGYGINPLVTPSMATVSSETNTMNNLELDNYCNGLVCRLNLSDNGFNETSATYSGGPGSTFSEIGLSTDQYPSADYVSSVLVYQNVPGYNPISKINVFQPATTLNPHLNASFDLFTFNSTYYNIIAMNPRSFNQPYQAEFTIDNRFNTSASFNGEMEVFGVYSNGNIKKLYWWNQTPMPNGGIIWVNLTRYIPNYLYVVYGEGALDSSTYSNNAIQVFPVFFSKNDPADSQSFASSLSVYGGPYGNAGVNGNSILTLLNNATIPPHVYRSYAVNGTTYGTFACARYNITGGLDITAFNASYSALPTGFNINDVYGNYPELYANLLVLPPVNNYGSWPVLR